ncbi:MAG TPA: 3-dehydroquinate synthase family protein [Anaeromyxobacteraceae bacterium]|nr:3-dehydroquinate synthase family protein [Anaeromyxobacteraceae bacterium]
MSAVLLEARQDGRRYPVEVGRLLPQRAAEVASGRDRVALVTCARVLETPLGHRVAAELGKGALAATVILPDGERGKTLAALESAARKLLRAGLTRQSLVVALGGGAVTDAAGLLAALYMRGVDWLALPTTLLAMVDAALGGKTGANLPEAKNAVGAFHPPVAVLSDPAALATLPERELRSGLGEALKYGFLRPALLPRMAASARRGRAGVELVAECARVKLEVVERDPKERGERKLLNLGHTFGHGVEAAGGFSRYKHGEAVAVGMAFAFRLARNLGRVGADAVARAEEAIGGARLPVRVDGAVARRALTLMGYDKKRTAAGLRWVLPVHRGSDWAVEWDVTADDGAVRATAREIGETR